VSSTQLKQNISQSRMVEIPTLEYYQCLYDNIRGSLNVKMYYGLCLTVYYPVTETEIYQKRFTR
jgi:hypothetical protein